MGTQNTILFLVTSLSLSVYPHSAQAQTHSDATSLFNDKLKNYNAEVRPKLDQTQTVEVNVTFNLMAVIEADDVTQRFVASGFLTLEWMDEILAWDLASYSNIEKLNPKADQIWKPRLVLSNTLGDRHLFQDDASQIIVKHTGKVTWSPGSVFPVSCKINLRKFPFDTQVCHIQMASMSLTQNEVIFTTPQSDVYLGTYTESGTWIIKDTKVTNGTLSDRSMFTISFTLERRHGFFMVNITLPVMMLSLLSIFVFLVPADSGEKISYGITVLLALSVFMAIVSDMLPRSSGNLPLVTIYLSLLFTISVCTVVMAIFIVWLHHREQCQHEDKSQKSKIGMGNLFKKVHWKKKSTKPLKHGPGPLKDLPVPDTSVQVPVLEPGDVDDLREAGKNAMGTLYEHKYMAARMVVPAPIPLPSDEPSETPKVNKYRVIGKCINALSFVVFLTIWTLVTLGFLVALTPGLSLDLV